MIEAERAREMIEELVDYLNNNNISEAKWAAKYNYSEEPVGIIIHPCSTRPEQNSSAMNAMRPIFIGTEIKKIMLRDRSVSHY